MDSKSTIAQIQFRMIGLCIFMFAFGTFRFCSFIILNFSSLSNKDRLSPMNIRHLQRLRNERDDCLVFFVFTFMFQQQGLLSNVFLRTLLFHICFIRKVFNEKLAMLICKVEDHHLLVVFQQLVCHILNIYTFE